MQKIQQLKLSEEVVNRVKQMIMSQTYRPGDKLPSEKELSEMFGVSRMSIREALAILSSAKIIDIRHGEGSFVQAINVFHYIPPVAISMIEFPEALLQLLEVRIILEASAAELAAERADTTALKDMEIALQGYLDEVSTKRSGDQYDLRLHKAIAQATGNYVLIEFMNRISDMIFEGMQYTLNQNIGNERKVREVYDEHARIVQAIQSRNPSQARLAMTSHLNNVRLKISEPQDRMGPRNGEHGGDL